MGWGEDSEESVLTGFTLKSVSRNQKEADTGSVK